MVNIKDLFQEGYKYHQSGNLAAAATCYNKILDKQPEHIDTIFLTGTMHLQQGNFDAATVFLKKAIALKPDYVTAYINLGAAQQSQGKFEEAIDCYRLAIRLKPDDAEAYKNLGSALREKGELDEAIESYRKATVLNPDDAEAHNDLGATLQKSGKLDEAIESHRQAIRLRPDYAKTHNNLGAALKEQGKHDEAIASYRQALSLKPDYAEAHNNLGIVLQEQEKFNEAIVNYNRAIALKPDYAEAYYNLANTLKIHGKTDEAIKNYKQAITLKQNYATAYVNLGIAFQGQGKSIDAISCYKKALEIKSDYASAYYNLGHALQEQGKLNEATCYYQKALELKPDHAEAHNNLGVIFQGQGKLNEAISCYQKALELKPDNAETYNNLFHQFQQTCAWQKLEDMSVKFDEFTTKALDNGIKTAETPFVSLTRHTNPSRVFAIAKSWSSNIARAMSTVKTGFSFDGRRSRKAKISIGYLSNDFRNHAVAHLMLSLFGLHNRSEFKIFCYSYGGDDGSHYGTRIRQDCDKFVDLRNLNYADAARCIYEDQVDILVDLKGHTRGNRLEICALRPAPVQVRYLGLAGTTGADFFDYIITDRIITPEEHVQYYSENFAYLPHCYQVNDSTQEISNKDWKKSDFGLPEDSFVFCSFNQGYKIEPVMFNAWMNILRQIPESVLWLKQENEITEKNLRREAEARGVKSDRIVFSEKLPKSEHLARLRLADVALDTRIINGAITTSDALWAGVPVITLQGGTFPSQMSSSILTAIGLPELITQTLGEYESLAIDLVHNSSKLQTVRQKLTKNLSTEPLFDTPRFTKNLEKAYKEMWKIFMAEKSPRQIDVMVNIKDLFQEGYKYHQSGNLAAAATFYLKVLDKQPEHVDTIFLTGTLHLQQGNLDVATTFLKKVIELKPDYAKAHNNLGAVLKEEGKLDDAVASYRRAIELKPDYAEAHNNLGIAFQEQGKLNEALTCYQKTLELKPDHAKVHYNLGTLLQEEGKYNEAVASYNHSIELNPDYAGTYYNLGIILHIQDKHDEAISSYQKALKLKPDFVEAHINIGNMFKDQGKFNEALSSYQNALRLKPDPGVEVKVALLLPIINESRESIKWYRNKLIEQIGSIKARGLTLDDPQKQIGSANFYLAYHGLNDREIQENIASFYIHTCPDLVWTPPDYNKQRETHDKIKIGIISNFLCRHTIGKLNYGVIKHLSREKFHVKLFRFSGGKEDPLSKAINSAADEVVILPKKLKPARQEIADHSLDILFYLDIGMDSLTYFLAFSRLAPVQCVTWGHPVTTGIPNMDYFISSDNAEPPGAENHYSERLVLPDRLTTYYYRPELPEESPSRGKFGLPEDYNLYVCPQTLFKFHPDFDNVLGDILRQDLHGLLVLIEGNHKHWTELLRDRFSNAFPDMIDRVRFLPRMPTNDYLSLLKTADVILDTPYFGGGSTSLESFACGMPIVTWPGEFMQDRLTLALYKQMGIMDCVANNAQSYLKIAYRLANDKIWRDEIRGKIRANADVLYEDIKAVQELERFFEKAVENVHTKEFSNLIASCQVS